MKLIYNKMTYLCSECNKIYSTTGNLKTHIKNIHQGRRDFQCNICNKTFTQKTDLKRHLKIVHDKLRDFKCKLCDYQSQTQYNLNRHIKQIHTKLKPKSMSRLEQRVSEILFYQKVQFTREFTFDNLRGNRNGLLRFDFAIQTDNDYRPILLIEVDGEQHERPVTFGHLTDDQAIDNFERIQRHDTLKNLYCTEAGYPLLRLKLTNYKWFDELIVEFLDKYL